VADFVYEKKLEMCMFVYLDEFLDHHRTLYPQDATIFGTDGIKRLLEASYGASPSVEQPKMVFKNVQTHINSVYSTAPILYCLNFWGENQPETNG
jgi:hypothetical protein